jgi:hypothetical protein
MIRSHWTRTACRAVLALPALVGVLTPAAAYAKTESGTRTGTATVPCPHAADAPVCGTRINVKGRSEFTLTPAAPADLDVFFYAKDKSLTDQYTFVGCDPEFGSISPDAVFAIVVVVEKSPCKSPRSVAFTYSYKVIPKSRCPINQSCRPAWAKAAVYGVLGVLFAPVAVVAGVSAARRRKDRREARKMGI